MQEVKYLLFTTTTCPKCPAIKAWIENHLSWCPGKVISNEAKDFMIQAQRHDITAAPTFLLFSKEQEVFRTDDIGVLEHYFKHYPS